MTITEPSDRTGRRAGPRALVAAAGVAAAALVGGLVAVAAPAHAADPMPCPGLVDTGLASGEADFDGDGVGDVAYGLPNDSEEDGGEVVVKTAKAVTTLTLTGTGAGTSNVGDDFGTVTRAERADADACTDLIVSAPGVDSDSGRVYVVFGANAGLGKGRPTMVIQAPRVNAGDRFGAALDTRSFGSHDYNVTTLVVGAPGTKVGRAVGAGAVHRFHINGENFDPSNTVSFGRIWTWTQGNRGVGAAEGWDHFGQVVHLTDDNSVIVGVPREDIGKRGDAGMVFVRTNGDKVVALSQDTKGVPDAAEKGDRFGSSVVQDGATLAVGASGEKIGKVKRAGLVQLFKQSPVTSGVYSPTRALTLDTAKVTGVPRLNDKLGANVAILRGFRKDGVVTVAAGLPSRTVGGSSVAGGVALFHLSKQACPKRASVCGRVLTQASTGVPGAPAAFGRFGASVAVLGDFTSTVSSDRRDTLVVGAPGATVAGKRAAGTITVWGPNGDTVTGNPAGARTGQRFGATAPARYTGASLYS